MVQSHTSPPLALISGLAEAAAEAAAALDDSAATTRARLRLAVRLAAAPDGERIYA